MTERINFLEVAARKKIGEAPEWEVFRWERVDRKNSDKSDFIVGGGVPRLLKSGKRKGKKTWRDCEETRVLVSAEDIEQAETDYVKETGNCLNCQGTGEAWAGWSAADGNRFVPCKRCDATGAAPA